MTPPPFFLIKEQGMYILVSVAFDLCALTCVHVQVTYIVQYVVWWFQPCLPYRCNTITIVGF